MIKATRTTFVPWLNWDVSPATLTCLVKIAHRVCEEELPCRPGEITEGSAEEATPGDTSYCGFRSIGGSGPPIGTDRVLLVRTYCEASLGAHAIHAIRR